jgi:hypothetical protein
MPSGCRKGEGMDREPQVQLMGDRWKRKKNTSTKVYEDIVDKKKWVGTPNPVDERATCVVIVGGWCVTAMVRDG